MGREEVVNVLLKSSGVDVNKGTSNEGVTPLCTACHKGHEHIVNILLKKCHYIDVHHTLKGGDTAMSIVVSKDHRKIVEAITARLQAVAPIVLPDVQSE